MNDRNGGANPAVRYSESVRASWALIAAIGGALGLTTGLMTAFAIRGELSGGEAGVFYVAMAFVAVLSVFILVNFTVLIIVVTDRYLHFRYGMFSRTLQFEHIRSAEIRPYRWLRYGGWGIRIVPRGGRAWSVPFVSTGVVVRTSADGSEREYYISSKAPDALRAALPE